MSTPRRKLRAGAVANGDRPTEPHGAVAGSTLPGFRIPFGSKLALIACISGIRSPCSCSSAPILPRPTPCSPVQVPPRASASSTTLCTSSSERSDLAVGDLHRDVEVAVARRARRSPRSARAGRSRPGRSGPRPASSVSGTQTSVARSFVPGNHRGGGVCGVVARLPEAGARVGVALVHDLGRALGEGDRLHELEVGGHHAPRFPSPRRTGTAPPGTTSPSTR